jgi:hypothetical protein
VPKYLAKKWTEAPENAEVGVIRITKSMYIHLILNESFHYL